MSTSTRRAGRRHTVRMLIFTVAYVAAVLVALFGVTALATSPWRFVVVVLPVVPAGFLAVAVRAYLREADEMERRIQMESIAAAFALGGLITFAYGFLQFAGAPPLSWVWVFPLLIVCWGVAYLVNRLRYR